MFSQPLSAKDAEKDGAREGLSSSGRKTNGPLVIVGAAEVVAAVGADQFAVVAGEAMAAGGADLAMVVDGVRHTTL